MSIGLIAILGKDLWFAEFAAEKSEIFKAKKAKKSKKRKRAKLSRKHTKSHDHS